MIKPTKDSVLRDFEQRMITILAMRLMGMKSDELKAFNYKNDDMPILDISLDNHTESIRLTIKAEWIPREDAT